MWIPARLNQLKDNRWVSGKLKKRDRQIVACYVAKAETPPPSGRRKVSLRVVLAKGQRAPDVDSYWKSLLDSLVKAGALVDDNRNGCETGAVEFFRSPDGTHGTTIILEDVEPAPKIRKLKKGEVVR
jgi:hypothetical protein